MIKYFVYALFLFASVFFVFALFQYYESYVPIDTGVFGDYGDFIGGALSVVSIYLLLETLKEQKQDSKEQQKSMANNNFNSVFFGLLSHLQKEIEDLNTIKNEGQYTNKDYFENLRKELQIRFQPQAYYRRNISQAVRDYTEIYVKNPRLAPYFRLLYRMCELTDNAEIDEDKKKDYIKILRAQLTGSELLLLRYNALTPGGTNFKKYIVRYNMLKHLPMFELLEFKKWWGKMQAYERYQISIFADSLKRCVRKCCQGDQSSNPFQVEGWELSIEMISDNEMRVCLSKTMTKLHGNMFSAIAPNELERLLRCMLAEIFSYSNFEIKRERSTLKIARGRKPTETYVCCHVSSLKKTSPLVNSFILLF